MELILRRGRIYVIPMVFILCLILSMAVRQLIADFYWKMAHQNGKEPNNMMGYLEKCIDVDSKNALFYFSMGRAFFRKGLAEATPLRVRNTWIRESIDEFHKAIDLQPSNSDYHFHLGLSYGCLTYPPHFSWEIVQNSFKRTAMLNPTDTHHLYSIGMYYLHEYDRLKNIAQIAEETGSAHYKKYAPILINNYQFYFRKLLDVNEEYLGKILDKSFSITQQYTDLKAVIRDTPNDHVYLARFLNRKGMWEEAKREYLMAINLDPANPLHYADFAHVLFWRGDVEHAIYCWQKYRVLNPQDKMAYLNLADGFVKLGRFDDALRELRDVITLHPRNIEFQVRLIKTLLAARRLDDAIGEYHKIVEDQNISKATYEKIRYYRRNGDHKKAMKILNEALSSALNR